MMGRKINSPACHSDRLVDCLLRAICVSEKQERGGPNFCAICVSVAVRRIQSTYIFTEK